MDPAPSPAVAPAIALAPRRVLVHLGLFAATCVTTYLANGPVFAATLMTILLTHEMGHYVAARRHGIAASLPYFIPVPFWPGTMGAIIRMPAPIGQRNQLVDVGAAGPLAGLAVAIPLLVWGLATSPITPAGAPGSFLEGNSVLYLGLKLLVHGKLLPADGVDVQLGPMAMAAWVGLLVTFINLLPIGQLDGGHVAAAFFGDAHERRARWLHAALPAVFVIVALWLYGQARAAAYSAGDAAGYAAQSALPWLVWTALLFVLRRASGGRYHPPVGDEPLTPGRRAVCFVVGAVFLLLITPIPMREALP